MIINNDFSFRQHGPVFALVLGLHAAAVFGMLRLGPPASRPEPLMVQPLMVAMGSPQPKVAPEPPKPEPQPKKVVQPKPKVVKTAPRAPVRQPAQPVQSAATMAVAAAETPVAPASDTRSQPVEPAAPAAGSAQPSKAPAETVAPSFHANYLNNPKPPYPPASLALGEEGTVMLKVQVSARGEADQVDLHRSSGFPRLDAAALSTVKRWRFVPARQGDTAVSGTVIVPLNFSIKKA